MIRYTVHFTDHLNQTVKAGDLLINDHTASFKYDPVFVINGVSLDPSELPLTNAVFNTYEGLFSVFEDALPDSWGRSMIVKKYGNKFTHPSMMLSKLTLGKSIGALSFSLHDSKLVKSQAYAIADLEGFTDKPETGGYFDAGSSAGGAQPKFSLMDNGTPVIVKMPPKDNPFDLAGLEAATMSVAKSAGMVVPDFSVGEVNGHRFYKIKRFDISEHGGRYHCISMKTILSVKGYYRKGYSDIAKAIKKYSTSPKEDCALLFKQCVFNALIGNTDDHLKNFMMIYNNGYRLSPCYDLLPNVRGSIDHVLSFDTDTLSPRLSELLNLSSKMGVKDGELTILNIGNLIRDEWPIRALAYDVPSGQVDKFTKDFARRFKKVQRQDADLLTDDNSPEVG